MTVNRPRHPSGRPVRAADRKTPAYARGVQIGYLNDRLNSHLLPDAIGFCRDVQNDDYHLFTWAKRMKTP